MKKIYSQEDIEAMERWLAKKERGNDFDRLRNLNINGTITALAGKMLAEQAKLIECLEKKIQTAGEHLWNALASVQNATEAEDLRMVSAAESSIKEAIRTLIDQPEKQKEKLLQ